MAGAVVVEAPASAQLPASPLLRCTTTPAAAHVQPIVNRLRHCITRDPCAKIPLRYTALHVFVSVVEESRAVGSLVPVKGWRCTPASPDRKWLQTHLLDIDSVLCLPGMLNFIRVPLEEWRALTLKPKTARMRALRVWSVNR